MIARMFYCDVCTCLCMDWSGDTAH